MIKELITRLKTFLQPVACFFGKHDWLVIEGTRKLSGFATVHLFFPMHELQEDELCDCCRLRKTRFGLYSSFDAKHYPDQYPVNPITGWPLDPATGLQLPGYLEIAGTYQHIPKPKFHGKDFSELKLRRRLF